MGDFCNDFDVTFYTTVVVLPTARWQIMVGRQDRNEKHNKGYFQIDEK